MSEKKCCYCNKKTGAGLIHIETGKCICSKCVGTIIGSLIGSVIADRLCPKPLTAQDKDSKCLCHLDKSVCVVHPAT